MPEENVELTRRNLAKQTFLRKQREIAELKENVYIDRITGLPNDKSFFEMLNGLQSSWERSLGDDVPEEGVFAEFDLTGLKIANDKYAKELGGNDYLRCVANSLKETLRPADRSFRMGTSADEFVIHLPENASKEDIDKILDRVDKKLKEYRDRYQSKYPGIEFGLSSTIATYGKDCSPKDAYKMVDEKMVEAKQSQKAGERVGNVGRIFCNL